MRIFAWTILAGAFLLFQVQPLIAKFILPWFGGSASVWSLCMLFFQVFLVAGYAYAHLTTRYLRPRTQAALHGVLLLAALLALPIVPGECWKPEPTDDPAGRILLLLTVCLGLPYFVLASTGPLMQAWFARLHPGSIPYRLYALSNAGSLLALVTYPFVVEPLLTSRTQANLWGLSLGVFALLCGACAWRLWRAAGGRKTEDGDLKSKDRRQKTEGGGEKAAGPAARTIMLWFALPACGSVLLLATTNKLCLDVASVPFLWILPLSLYLLTFILCFDRPAWYARKAFTLLLVPVLAMLCYALFRGSNTSILTQVLIYCISLSAGCMVCHGEVYRLKPAPHYLTLFYLLISIGGAAGGAFVALAAPRIFRSYAELNWGIGLLMALVCFIHMRERSSWTLQGRRWPLWPVMACGLAVLAAALTLQSQQAARNTVSKSRNFHGTLQVLDNRPDDPAYHIYRLINGQITHGLQFTDPAKAAIPTTYYDERSGAGLALTHFPRQTNRRIGAVGLGVGTLAAYGSSGDTFRFYEINPEVERLARTWFTYLKTCKAHIEVVTGDARISLESEPPQEFDLIVLDAFSSDAIPTHLLTKEAFETYLRHLKTDGVIAVHISSRHLNLYPVTLGVAEHFQLGTVYILTAQPGSLWWYSPSKWVLLSRNLEFLNSEEIAKAQGAKPSRSPKPILWTDNYTSLLRVLGR